MWRPLIDKLKDKFTVIAPDLPGIGDSDIPRDGSDMKTAAIRIRALAKSIGVTKARVVGHDIGLMVAYALCRAVPRGGREARRYGRFPSGCSGMGARV
jgi:pimeloyl-ACP methyl ester carboxylesterase